MFIASIAAACIAVAGPTITARDLAKAVPEFTPSDPAAVVGYAPEPDVDRVMTGSEIRAALHRLGFDTNNTLSNACFSRPVTPLAEQDVVAAIRNTLGQNANVEVVELTRLNVPAGELTFPVETLGAPPIALWRGYVKYDGGKKFSVWARVKLSVPTIRAIAKTDLAPGTPIQESQIELKTEDMFPDRRKTPQTAEELEGLLPRRVIPAGTPIWMDAVAFPPAVAKGDRVTVLVHSGRTQLSFDAESESAARIGEMVSLKNPDSGKIFRARVSGKSMAAIETGVSQ